MSWNIEKPGDRINGPLTITGNTTLTGTATISGDLTVDTSTLKVDATNNRVGVGTASPSVPLDVVGNAKISGDLVVDTNTLVVDSTNNRLGIGTSSPSAKLEVNDANGIPIRLGDIAAPPASQTAVYVGASTSALSGANGDLVLVPRTSDARSILFYTGSGTASLKATLDANGNLGIGVVPSALAGFGSTIRQKGNGAAGGFFTENSTSASWFGIYSGTGLSDSASVIYPSGGSLRFATTTSVGVGGYDPKMTLAASGNLGVGVSPSYRLHVVDNSTNVISRWSSSSLFGTGLDIVNTGTGGARYTLYSFGQSNGADYQGNFGIIHDSGSGLVVLSGGHARTTTGGTASVCAFGKMGDHNTGLYFPTGNDTLALAVGGSDALYIDSNRNVGFGIVPAARLVSAGSSSTVFKGLILRNADGTTGSSATIDFETSNGTHGDEAAMAGRISGIRTGAGTSGAIAFSTTSGGTLGERLRIKSTGQLRFVPLASDPGSAEAGDVYYNSTTNKLRCYNGSAWNDLF